MIKSIELSNFRNYESLNVNLSGNVTILYGDNAQGKTNILEALFLASTTKSQKGSRDREMIRLGENESHIRMIIDNKGIERKIDMHLRANKAKGVAIDGIPIKKASELYGMMNIISFSPDDLSIVKDGPAERRHFCDTELCQLDKLYMHNLSGYLRSLDQRNNLLKQISINPELKGTLDIWDEQLVNFGKYLIERRSEFVDELNVIAAKIHKRLTNDREELEIRYIPSAEAGQFAEKLRADRDRDIFLKMTNEGPHRDDLEFIINGGDGKKFGSQGQQRTVCLTLKLAEIELVKAKTGENPVLLLDDVLSELDENRQTKLLESINEIQTVITCTGLEGFVKNRIKYDRVYKVNAGTVTRES